MKPHAAAILALAAALASMSLLADAAQRRGKADPDAVIAEDRGRFRAMVGGQVAGSEEFQIARSGGEWLARGNTQITTAGGAARLTSNLRLRPDGTPVSYDFEWTGADGTNSKAKVLFVEGTVRIETQVGTSQPFVQEFFYDSPRVVVLDNNLYHHYALLVRLYDWKARGAQGFNVLIPQDLTPGSITVEALGQREVGKTRYEVLRMRTADLEADLFVDNNRRLVRIDVPASQAEIIRE